MMPEQLKPIDWALAERESEVSIPPELRVAIEAFLKDYVERVQSPINVRWFTWTAVNTALAAFEKELMAASKRAEHVTYTTDTRVGLNVDIGRVFVIDRSDRDNSELLRMIAQSIAMQRWSRQDRNKSPTERNWPAERTLDAAELANCCWPVPLGPVKKIDAALAEVSIELRAASKETQTFTPLMGRAPRDYASFVFEQPLLADPYTEVALALIWRRHFQANPDVAYDAPAANADLAASCEPIRKLPYPPSPAYTDDHLFVILANYFELCGGKIQFHHDEAKSNEPMDEEVQLARVHPLTRFIFVIVDSLPPVVFQHRDLDKLANSISSHLSKNRRLVRG